MTINEVEQEHLQKDGSENELKRLTDFYSLLIQIDKRVNPKQLYEEQDK